MNLKEFEGIGGLVGDLFSAINVFKRSPEGQLRRNLKVLEKSRDRAFMRFMKDGVLDEREKNILIIADDVIINAWRKLAS